MTLQATTPTPTRIRERMNRREHVMSWAMVNTLRVAARFPTKGEAVRLHWVLWRATNVPADDPFAKSRHLDKTRKRAHLKSNCFSTSVSRLSLAIELLKSLS
jgi:hypothetical protein